MSRIGKQPVAIPAGVQVEVTSTRTVKIKGPKGQNEFAIRPEVSVAVKGAQVTVDRAGDDRQSRAFHGTTRALIASAIRGVTTGYQKELEVVGVGWNAAVQGRKVVLSVGFCKPAIIDLPEGVNAACPTATLIVLTGFDKQKVGMTASRIRSTRKPEPYKGKGVRYKGEYVRQKAGKSFGS
ncbi:MAG: 50S ribosomal protein L6 [Planctomycetes bacterium]|nr:50S ribosomal protein L6 [Planctomycetota bacterium]